MGVTVKMSTYSLWRPAESRNVEVSVLNFNVHDLISFPEPDFLITGSFLGHGNGKLWGLPYECHSPHWNKTANFRPAWAGPRDAHSVAEHQSQDNVAMNRYSKLAQTCAKVDI